MVLALTRAGVGATADRRVGGLWRELAEIGGDGARHHLLGGCARSGSRLLAFSVPARRAAMDALR